jgi:hypothetical protein
MLTALALVALVAVAIAAALSVFRLDLRRTAGAVDDAQLRQLLLAGQRAVRDRLPRDAGAVPTIEQPMALPPPLAAEGAVRLHLRPGAARDTADAGIEARLGNRTATQTLRYERGPTGWSLVSADPAPPARTRVP